MRTSLGILTGALLTLLLATNVLADAQIAFIEPAKGQTMLEPPDQVRIFFKEPVRGEFLEVYDEQGNRVDEGDAKVEPPVPPSSSVDIEHEAIYAVSLRQEDMSEGLYTATYRVTSADGHSVGEPYEFGIGDVDVQPNSQAKTSEGDQQKNRQRESEAPRITLTAIVPLVAICGGIVLVATLVLGTAALLRRRK
jgi:methionine-rich copper-binding protein CopC